MENEVKIADYIQRMIEEKKELDEKIVKLVAFRYSDKGDELLDDNQRYLLNNQFEAMTRYSDVLGHRIYNEKIKTGIITPSAPQGQDRGECCNAPVCPRY